MMNKKISTLTLLTSLLFIGCANTQEARTKVTIPQVQKQEIDKKIETTPSKTELQPTISFIENKEILEKGMMHIDAFMGSLQPTLKGLLKSDSTHVTAMGACSSMARKMISDYNNQIQGVKLKRTALKYRNPKNKPDKIDRMAMDTIVEKNTFKPLLIDVGDHYRVYKPLAIKQSCLLCHGARNEISPDVLKMIDRTYPKDLATGFELGEFRGAVVAEIQK